MAKQNRKLIEELSGKLQLPVANSSERTTFKLNKSVCDSLDWISEQFPTLSTKNTLNLIIDFSPSDDENQQFETLMNEFRKYVEKGSVEEPIRKTYVIGARQLKELNGLAKKLTLDRDILLSIQIECFRALLSKRIETDKKHLKNVFRKLEQALDILESIQDSSDEFRVFKAYASEAGNYEESDDISTMFSEIRELLGAIHNGLEAPL